MVQTSNHVLLFNGNACQLSFHSFQQGYVDKSLKAGEKIIDPYRYILYHEISYPRRNGSFCPSVISRANMQVIGRLNEHHVALACR